MMLHRGITPRLGSKGEVERTCGAGWSGCTDGLTSILMRRGQGTMGTALRLTHEMVHMRFLWHQADTGEWVCYPDQEVQAWNAALDM